MLLQQRTFFLWEFIGLVICGTTLVSSAEEPVAMLVRSAAPDWPQWRGPRRDGVSEETGLLPSWPVGGPRLLWTAAGIGKGYSSPIVVDGTIYITGDQDDDLIIGALLGGRLAPLAVDQRCCLAGARTPVPVRRAPTTRADCST